MGSFKHWIKASTPVFGYMFFYTLDAASNAATAATGRIGRVCDSIRRRCEDMGFFLKRGPAPIILIMTIILIIPSCRAGKHIQQKTLTQSATCYLQVALCVRSSSVTQSATCRFCLQGPLTFVQTRTPRRLQRGDSRHWQNWSGV